MEAWACCWTKKSPTVGSLAKDTIISSTPSFTAPPKEKKQTFVTKIKKPNRDPNYKHKRGKDGRVPSEKKASIEEEP